jgi:hypothetical protein
VVEKAHIKGSIFGVDIDAVLDVTPSNRMTISGFANALPVDITATTDDSSIQLRGSLLGKHFELVMQPFEDDHSQENF